MAEWLSQSNTQSWPPKFISPHVYKRVVDKPTHTAGTDAKREHGGSSFIAAHIIVFETVPLFGPGT